jgi:hypothetical protein
MCYIKRTSLINTRKDVNSLDKMFTKNPLMKCVSAVYDISVLEEQTLIMFFFFLFLNMGKLYLLS